MMKHKSQHRPVLNYIVDKKNCYQLLSETSLDQDLFIYTYNAGMDANICLGNKGFRTTAPRSSTVL